MPFIIRFILQGILAASLSILTFLGINPSIPTQDQVATTDEQRQEIVGKILEDVNNQIVDLDKNLIEDLVTPSKPNIQPKIEKASTKNKDINSPETKIASTSPENTVEPKPEIQPEKPIDIIIETINDKILPKNKNELDIEKVLVNIICTEKKGNYVTANTGSGVIISQNGVVLTNSHVAQYFLLTKPPGNYKCALYQENIPTYGYVAELLYISPDWIKSNAEVIVTKNPRGTGENDYALLYITKNTNPVLSKPKSFSFVNPKTNYEAKIGDRIIVAGFPGSPSSLGDLSHTVGLKTDSTEIKDIFTFGNNAIDVVSTDITPMAARGASGGGIFKDSDLIALIVTTGGKTDNAYINAITTNYINRDLKKDFGISLNDLINRDLTSESENFWDNFGKDLARIILAEL